MHTPSEILNLAADTIQQRGWTQAEGWFPEDLPADAPLCAEGAIRLCAGIGRKTEITGILGHYLADLHPDMPISNVHGGVVVFWWNDTPGMTAEKVIGAMRACAAIEASRENSRDLKGVTA